MPRKKGTWDWGGNRFGSNTEEDDRQVAHRNAMEKEHMTRLASQMRARIPEQFKVEYRESTYGDEVEVSLDGLTTNASVKFRYTGFSFGDKGCAEGITVKADGVYGEIEGLGRAYGYDFEAGCMKAPALTKMCAAITNHLQRLVDRKVAKAKRKSASQKHADEMAALLRAEGFNVRLSEWSNEDTQMNVEGVVILKVSSTGLAYSTGRHESVPIRAKSGNIVEVVKATKHLRDIIGGHAHEHH